MTTKPKTRKAPAAKTAAPKPAPVQNYPAIENDICKLIARWNYLEADRKYYAALTSTRESDSSLHAKEKEEIKGKLADLVPKNFTEVYDLFDFAMAAILMKVEYRDRAKTEIKMLNTLRRGIFEAEVKEQTRFILDTTCREREKRRHLAEAPELR